MNSCLNPVLQYCTSHQEQCLVRHFQPGDPISLAGEAVGSLLVIYTGSIRFVDSTRSFSSLTLSIIDAPYLLGLSAFSGHDFNESVRAATNVTAYQVSASFFPPDIYSNLIDFWKTTLDPREWVLILQCLYKAQDESSPISPLLDLPPASWPFLSNAHSQGSFRRIIYLDSSRSGFEYGHIYPFKFLEAEFPECDLPRFYPIFDSILGCNLQSDLTKTIGSSLLEEPYDLTSLASSENESINEKSIPSLLQNDFVPSEFGFDLIHASDPKASLVACLSMLCRHLKLPTRLDVLQSLLIVSPLMNFQ